MENVGLICLTVLGLVTVCGIFKTKTAGWGRYSSSLLIFAVALFIAASLVIINKLEGSWFLNILFAVVGYAGGLLTTRKEEPIQSQAKESK
jgi:hypothetical protein